YLY
ncbi:uncharacterized protein DNG_10502, partial [Cephalotrichum gorgonifer]